MATQPHEMTEAEQQAIAEAIDQVIAEWEQGKDTRGDDDARTNC